MMRLFRLLNLRPRQQGEFPLEIEKRTGIKPQKLDLYELALRHSSASNQRKGYKLNNQRLEYLGDAVLGAVVADFLYTKYPGRSEGFLTSMRSKIVSRRHLNWLAEQIDLPPLLVKKHHRTLQAKSIYGDAMEALIGAIYLDHGYDCCRDFILKKLMREKVNLKKLEYKIASHKGALLEWGQKNKKVISFELTGSWGESHDRKYEISILLDEEFLCKAMGSSKKKAEEEAAKIAYKNVLQHEPRKA